MFRANTSPLFAYHTCGCRLLFTMMLFVAMRAIALAELQAAAQKQVVVDGVMTGAIVQVHIPAMVAAPAVVAQDNLSDHIQEGQLRVGGDFLFHGLPCGLPVAVAAPGVEAAVVVCLQHRIEHVTKLDEMTAPAAIADVDARARHIINRAVSHGDPLRHGDLHRRGLLLKPAAARDQTILHQTVGGIVVRLRAGRPIQLSRSRRSRCN